MLGLAMHGPQNLNTLLFELHNSLDDHSFFLCSCHKRLRYDVNRALPDYLWPLSDGLHERTVVFRSAYTRKYRPMEKCYIKTLTPSLHISSVFCRLWPQ